MTNNLKAERTLTAEELQTLFPDGIPVVAMKVLFPEKSGPLTTEEVRLILQSLSTQQPMGEVTWERMARAQSRKLQAVLHVPGVKDALHELDWENGDPLDGWDFVRLSALHPNQESGE